MARFKTKFVCQQCGYEASGWLGKCPSCSSWNSFVEQLVDEATSSRKRNKSPHVPPVRLSSVNLEKKMRLTTESVEFDRVLGGGLVAGSVVLLAGEPGIGKSTLLLKLAQNVAKRGKVLYMSGEESAQQIKIRAERLIIAADNIYISSETDADVLVTQIEQEKPQLVIVDSIQTLTTSDLTGVAGSVGQVRECSSRLQEVCKRLHIPICIIGHVTKEGSIAGPKVLEHLVDVVLYLEGERFHTLRILRGVKNRFGSTDEVGIFEMHEGGLEDGRNIERLFLNQTETTIPGSIAVVVAEGTRPMLVEIQSLVVYSKIPMVRRVASGIDYNRLQMLVAVISKHLRLSLSDYDVYVNVASGFKIQEPAADLGVCLAIISSFKNKLIPQKSVAIGEVGLLGEIRPVPAQERRVKEAKNLGYTNIYTNSYRTLSSLVKEVFGK